MSDAEGVKIPVELTPFPDHVPPDGIPFNCKGLPSEQIETSVPALTVAAALTRITAWSKSVQPLLVTS